MANYNYDFWSKEHEWKGGGMKDRALTNQSIDKSLAERRLLTDRTRAEQDRQLKRNIMNYNMGQAIVKDMDDLNITADSGAGGFDAILQQGSREMADYAAHLTKELQRTGDYATYSREMAALKSQVGDMKALKGDVQKTLVAFNTMNEAGNLSDYVSADIRAAMQDMQSTSPSGSFQNVDGQQMWVGETVTGKPYRIAASEFKNLTNKLVPKQDVDGILNNAMKVQTTASGNILGFDEPAMGLDGTKGMSAADYAQDALDDTLDSRGNENRHRMAGALLTDKFGYSEAEAKNLLSGGWDDAYEILKKEWNDQARSQYGINQKAVNQEKRAQQTQYEQYKEKLDNRRDVQNTVNHLPIATWQNNDENDPISKGYQFKGERESNPDKWSQDIKNSLVQKGFNAPKPLLENGGEPILDETAPNGFRMPRVVGYEIINEKLPANRRTPVQLMFTDWDNMPNVWEKIYAATGVESFKAGAGFKNYTNDPLNQRQGTSRIKY
tara:strand:- start:925 stop:2412 length:1488 start_codon:yes stop_codon:yes gene_type:complete